ncbi:MAG: hypothetical protein ACI857_001752 [Arenicella sp.]|jgi:hypothetical protein
MMVTKLQSLRDSLHSQVSAAPLTVYRICFGLLMLFSTVRFISKGWVTTLYVEPDFHFSYYGFEWLPYPSEIGIWILFSGLIIGSILITLGLFYRYASIGFFICFTYIELLDKANYLNHYYFVTLISFLLIFISANRQFSLDNKFGFIKSSDKCSLWEIRILQFQIAVVYIFAGIAKIESDWLLEAQPLKYWLHTANHWPVFGDFLKQDWVAYAFSWFGCFYDLLIVLFLIIPKTRKTAYFFVLIFHLTTWLLFPIGVFPWVMMVGTLIFFAPPFHEKILGFLRGSKESSNEQWQVKRRTSIIAMLAVFCLIQIVVPFRHLAYEGDVFYTESGYRFSWRVMLMEKTADSTFYAYDAESGLNYEIDNSDFLTTNQEKMMSSQPDMILDYANYLGECFNDTSFSKFGEILKFETPEIRAEIYVTINARPHQLFVNNDKNLLAIENGFAERDWLEPFEE